MATGSRKGSRGSRGSSGPRGTLGTLLRTTLAQAGVVRDVLERGAREGRARFDDARRVRRRDQALIRLGEAVVEAVRNGAEETQGLFDLPDVADALAELDGLDAGAEESLSTDDEDDADGDQRGPSRAPVWVPPGIRERFDKRPPRPPPIEPVPTDDDGTVSSKQWKPPATKPAAAAKERPRKTLEEPGARFQEKAPAARKGGIQFSRDEDDNDEDLASYMHPDDVPPKPKT